MLIRELPPIRLCSIPLARNHPHVLQGIIPVERLGFKIIGHRTRRNRGFGTLVKDLPMALFFDRNCAEIANVGVNLPGRVDIE